MVAAADRTRSSRDVDLPVAALIAAEAERRATTIDLMASETQPDPPALEAPVAAADNERGTPGASAAPSRHWPRGSRRARLRA